MTVSGRLQIPNWVSECLYDVDYHGESFQEQVVLGVEVSFEYTSDEGENGTEGEENDAERIDVVCDLDQHFDQKGKRLIVSDQLQKLYWTLH